MVGVSHLRSHPGKPVNANNRSPGVIARFALSLLLRPLVTLRADTGRTASAATLCRPHRRDDGDACAGSSDRGTVMYGKARAIFATASEHQGDDERPTNAPSPIAPMQLLRLIRGFPGNKL
jgi:hypothetical protein